MMIINTYRTKYLITTLIRKVIFVNYSSNVRVLTLLMEMKHHCGW